MAEFQWNNELFKEFEIFVELKCGETGVFNPSLLLIYEWRKQFIQSKVKKEEPKQWEILSVSEKDKIHSVKRLSDNEVFSIGDYITYKNVHPTSWGGGRGKGCDIQSFYLSDNTLYINEHYMGVFKDKRINDWVKLPQRIKVEWLDMQPVMTGKNIPPARYEFQTTSHFPKEKYEPIKKAIEGVLNNDGAYMTNEQVGKWLMSFHNHYTKE